MSVVSVKIKGQRTFSVNDKPNVRASRTYQVICSDRNDGADVAALACPAINEAFSPRFPTLLVSSVNANEGERTGTGGVIYEVTIDYGTPDGGGGKDPDQKDPDPTQRAGQLRLSFASSDETFWQMKAGTIPKAVDADGADVTPTWIWGSTVCNSAGTPFKDGLRETVYDAVYTFEKNVTVAGWVKISNTLDDYAGAVNSDAFTVQYRGERKTFAKGTVLLMNPSSDSGYENGIPFERVSVQLAVRKDGWEHKVLDQGLRFWTGTGTPGTPATNRSPDGVPRDSLGQESADPVFLDGKGKRIGASAKPVFLKFPRRKGEKAFKQLGFDEFG